MKQFQFEVKNLNYLRRELSRIKRFCSNEEYKSVNFEIFTQITDQKEFKNITRIIENEFPEANYYGFQTFGNIHEGALGKQKTLIICSIVEFETTISKLVYIDPSKKNADFKNLDALWEYCNSQKWVKGVELITSFKGSKKLLPGGPLLNLREDIQVFGGVSCNPIDIADENSFVFSKKYGRSDKGIVAILMGGDDLHIYSDYIRGWEGLGKSFTITKCDQNKILEIDEKPAIHIYKKYLNIEQDENFAQNTTLFPLLVEQNKIECIRFPSPTEDKKSLEFGVNFQEGMKVRLSYGDKPTIINHIKQKLPLAAGYSPDSIHFFSCALRRTFWGDENVSSETLPFDSIAPTTGCYTHGEILRIGNYLYHFNATMVYVLIREGEPYDLDYSFDEGLDNVEEESALAPKLINYVGAVSSELEGQFTSTMTGMANIYKSMFLIDLGKETLTQLDGDAKVKAILAEKNDLKEKMDYFLHNVIVDQTLDHALKFCNLDNLVSRMEKLNSIDCELIGKTIGWFRAQFVVINRDEKGLPDRFVFTTQGINEQKKHSEEQQRIIQTLADTYHTLHLFDLKADTCSEVSAHSLIHNLSQDYKDLGTQELLHLIFKKLVTEKYLNEVLDFTNLSLLPERLKNRKMISIEFLGNINGWFKASFIKYEENEKGELVKVLFATQTIDDVKKREEKLVQTSRTDELTELLNRRAFEEELKELEVDFSQKEIAIVSIDVNGLKDANDDHGHEAGDELLTGTADCLRMSLGAYGNVFRTGGDEFAAIVYADKNKIESLLSDLERNVQNWRGKLVSSLSLSFGYVLTSEKTEKNIRGLLKLADQRMYQKKEEYYRLYKGIDRRKQKYAFETICETYIKILRGNLTKDTFEIIKAETSELAKPKGYDITSLSKWFESFVTTGQIHKDDADYFYEKSKVPNIIKHFENEKQIYHIIYKRKFGKTFKKVVMEISPTKEFTKENMDVFIFVKDISF